MDEGHPYIEHIYTGGNWLIGGEIELLDKIMYNDGLDKWRLSAVEVMAEFEKKGADAGEFREDMVISLCRIVTISVSVECCIRNLLSSSVISYRGTSISHGHNANIHPPTSFLLCSLRLPNQKSHPRGTRLSHENITRKAASQGVQEPRIMAIPSRWMD